MCALDLIAHRGYAARYPENTLPAIEAALQSGARHIEIDVQTSADHVPVLFHDPTLERLCGVPGRIRDADLAVLAALRASEPTRFGDAFRDVSIPTLSAVADLLCSWPEVMLFVEIKAEAIDYSGIDETYWRCAAVLAPLVSRVVMISFDDEFMRAARRHGWPQLGCIVQCWAERERPGLVDIAPQYLFTDATHLPENGTLHWRDAQLAVYEVTDAGQALSLAARGVELIETFAIVELRAALKGITR